MFLFLFACLVSGGFDEDGVELHIDKNDLQLCHDVSTNSQKSSLKIAIMIGEEVIGHGSGNYFKLGKHRFVLTAAHVAMSEYDVKIMDGDKLIEVVLVFADVERDIAILVPKEELYSVTPHRWSVDDNEDILGKSVNYTGHPSGLGKLIIRGVVSAYSDEGFIMQSFALPGSSGSVVFDNHGKVLGVGSAVLLDL